MSVAAVIAALSMMPSPEAPDLAWLQGYWLSCDSGREVSETWSDVRAGQLSGMTMTTRGDRVSIEFARIAPRDDILTYQAQPDGQPSNHFTLSEAGPTSVTFADPDHDFPQVVRYVREGETLTARIEGRIDDQPRTMEWRYRRTSLNSRCPA